MCKCSSCHLTAVAGLYIGTVMKGFISLTQIGICFPLENNLYKRGGC